MTRTKVSVCLITYNQEKYVAEAVDSALSQRAPFDFEIVMGEDCSTDGTRAIVEDFAARFPDRIRLRLQESNVGLVRNFLDTFQSCRGEYVALLDGDDYWTDPGELAKQAAFLDAHPECSICFHDAQVLLPDGTFCEANYTAPDQPRITTIENLFETNFIATCSAMLRRDAVSEIPEWYANCLWEDWPLYLLYADRGRIGYLPEAMGVYRSHSGGLWSGLDPVARLERVVGFLASMDAHLGGRYSDLIEKSLCRYAGELDRLRSARAASLLETG